jgi:hypothetical protein
MAGSKQTRGAGGVKKTVPMLSGSELDDWVAALETADQRAQAGDPGAGLEPLLAGLERARAAHASGDPHGEQRVYWWTRALDTFRDDYLPATR